MTRLTAAAYAASGGHGLEAGLEVLGFSSQARFLVNCGITDLMAETPAADAAAYAPLAAQAQKLLSPAEMGELFKVIALGRDVSAPLTGFSSGDRRSASVTATGSDRSLAPALFRRIAAGFACWSASSAGRVDWSGCANVSRRHAAPPPGTALAPDPAHARRTSSPRGPATGPRGASVAAPDGRP